VLGCRLNIRQVSYGWKAFARGAYRAMIDIDAAELKKPTLHLDLPVHADLADALPALLKCDFPGALASHREWLTWCKERQERFPVCLPDYWNETGAGVNPYCFVDMLFRRLPDDQIVVTGDGTACVTTFQGARIGPKMRLYTNSGCASMGYDLPGAIGAALASKETIVCLAGDGSIMMNLQELATIAGRRMPIKIFILNNQGYHSIRQTQQNFFPDNVVGCGLDSGLCFPDFGRLAAGFGLPFRRVRRHADLEACIRDTLAGAGPEACEIFLDLAQPFAPKLSSKRLRDGRMVTAPLEDMTPLLDRDLFAKNMLIPPIAE
jgi:acetolactate synthase-1/2/3 large subunit